MGHVTHASATTNQVISADISSVRQATYNFRPAFWTGRVFLKPVPHLRASVEKAL